MFANDCQHIFLKHARRSIPSPAPTQCNKKEPVLATSTLKEPLTLCNIEVKDNTTRIPQVPYLLHQGPIHVALRHRLWPKKGLAKEKPGG